MNIVEDVETFYKDNVVHLSKPFTDAKIVHEFVHNCQDKLNNGPARNWREWRQREREAKYIELQWLDYVASGQ